jgi:hypothetical protein
MYQAFFFEFFIVLWSEQPLSHADWNFCFWGESFEASAVVFNEWQRLA